MNVTERSLSRVNCYANTHSETHPEIIAGKNEAQKERKGGEGGGDQTCGIKQPEKRKVVDVMRC